MITITNGVDVIQVTQGAFTDIFKSQGFIEINEKQPETRAEVTMSLSEETIERGDEHVSEAILDQKSGDPKFETTFEEEKSQPEEIDLSEIPLSEMTDKQLKEYAAQLGVDISGITSRKAVRNKIRSAL